MWWHHARQAVSLSVVGICRGPFCSSNYRFRKPIICCLRLQRQAIAYTEVIESKKLVFLPSIPCYEKEGDHHPMTLARTKLPVSQQGDYGVNILNRESQQNRDTQTEE